MDKDYKDLWIEKTIQELMVYEKDKTNIKKTGFKLRKLRESLCIKKVEIKVTSYNYYVKIENGLSCITRKKLYKILAEFYDIAEKKHDIIEEILWPIDFMY